jgi:hypothetical protein
MHYVVVFGDIEGVPKKSEAVFPISQLHSGAYEHGNNQQAGGQCGDKFRQRQFSGKVSEAPGKDDENPDGWHIGISVGNGLYSDLDKAYYGY